LSGAAAGEFAEGGESMASSAITWLDASEHADLPLPAFAEARRCPGKIRQRRSPVSGRTPKALISHVKMAKL
jgi:hypothetical protein